MQGRLVSYPLTLVLSHCLNETRIRTKNVIELLAMWR